MVIAVFLHENGLIFFSISLSNMTNLLFSFYFFMKTPVYFCAAFQCDALLEVTVSKSKIASARSPYL